MGFVREKIFRVLRTGVRLGYANRTFSGKNCAEQKCFGFLHIFYALCKHYL